MASAAPPTVVVHAGKSFWKSWTFRGLAIVLGLSILANLGMYAAFRDYFSRSPEVTERYLSGDKSTSTRIAVVRLSGTIMPPLTERLIRQIEVAAEDDRVKGVLLTVDSPGGLVADSHQIYHALEKLRAKKPIFVQMKRLAASGGYYIAMGAGTKGQIYAEPTTWTGSIGVIIPRYDASGLVEKLGISSDPLKTGEFKDALSPFHPLSEAERKVWEDILNQSFEQFVELIDTNRDTLDREQARKLATGQIYTARDARANGLIDQIGFEEDALAAFQKSLQLDKVRVVEYRSPTQLVDLILGSKQKDVQAAQWQALVDATTPRAMYLCSWLPAIPNNIAD